MIYFSDFGSGGGGSSNPYGLVGVSASSGVASGSGAVTINIPYPAGLAADDIAVVHILLKQGGEPVSYGTLPTGYVEKVNTGIGAGEAFYHHYMFWKRLDGSESGNFSLAITAGGVGSVRLGMMSVWGGCVDTGDPFDDQVYAVGASANCVSSALTTANNDEIVVNLIASDRPGTNSFTPPATYTEGYDVGTALGNDALICMNYKTVATAGSVAASTTVCTAGGAYGVISFGLIPA